MWCGPCKQIAPTVDALADAYKGKLKVAKMDVDHHQVVPQQYGVRSIPTLLIFKGGKVVGQLVGVRCRVAKLEAEIQKAHLVVRMALVLAALASCQRQDPAGAGRLR